MAELFPARLEFWCLRNDNVTLSEGEWYSFSYPGKNKG